MKQVKIIFESDENGEEKRFGYILDKESLTYSTVHFDKRYEPFKTFEKDEPIGDPTTFGKSMWRLIRMALTEGNNGGRQSGANGFSR